MLRDGSLHLDPWIQIGIYMLVKLRLKAGIHRQLYVGMVPF